MPYWLWLLAPVAATLRTERSVLRAFRDLVRGATAAGRKHAADASLLAANPDAMLRLDRGGRILAANAGDRALLVLDPAQLIGRPVVEVTPPAFAEPILQHVARALDSRVMQTFEYQDGVHDFETRVVAAGCDDVLVIVRNNTERKALERQLAHQAFHDPLTGLPNRALFTDRLEHALTRAPRRGVLVAVLFLDLDRFKAVNDSLGHDVGDQLLVGIAGLLRACVRGGDTVARLGGDEFTVLLEDLAAPGDASHVAERIMAAMQKPFALGGQELSVSASLGVALSTGHGTPDELLRDADAALYRSKNRGKARYEVFDATMQARAVERVRLENDLRHGIERGDLRVYYQPMVDLATGRIAGVEALARWQHPTRGFLPPDDFIPLAEESSLILPLSRWVLAESCRQAAAWTARYPNQPPVVVSVNLSVRQFQHPALAEEVRRALRESALDPRCLQLEITESMMMETGEATGAILRDLKALGVRLSIDDFGTGYSNLGYLKRFPVDSVKIDRSFVAGLGRAGEGDGNVVQALVGLAHSLGMSVVAEGVETPAQRDELRAAGCELGQGYYFSRPLPAGGVEALFALKPEGLAAVS